MKPSGDERQHLRRRGVQPLRIVDHAQQRLILCRVGEKAEHRQSDQEPIRLPSRAETERRLEAARCGAGSRSSRPSIGSHNWCTPAYTSPISDSTPTARVKRNPRGRVGHIFQERGLAHSRLATKHQGPALACLHRVHQLIERRALRTAAEQHVSCLEAEDQAWSAEDKPDACSGATQI
jgi:hypothetical protein